MNNVKKLLLYSFLVIGLLSIISSASAANVVDTMNNAEIQNVIDTTNDTTVFFTPGTYQDISLTINKTLNLQGNGSTLNFNSGTPIVLNVISTTNVVINNFTINSGRAIVVNSTNNINITNNVINMGTDNDAISLTSVNTALIQNNELNGNAFIIQARDGIGIVNSSDVTISNNDIFSFYRNGISLAAGFMGVNSATSNIVINDNIIYNIGPGPEEEGQGIFFGGGVTGVTISNNYICNVSGNGINIARSTVDILIDNNTIIDCIVGVRVEEGNTFHNASSPTVIENVTITNNFFYGNVVAILLVNVVNSTGSFSISNNNFVNNVNNITNITVPLEETSAEVNNLWSVIKNFVSKIISFLWKLFK
ncbi:MAG: right-handed parallel beta-helix repeat-containing protein [Methanobrevibacter sp.]|nr:right-handed parallel beta-helix repeat-containing protein [Methanobrevibacter sp.]